MGAAAGSLEGNSCDEQVEFWTLWHESTAEDRLKIRVGISRKINELMRDDAIRSARDFKTQLAAHVKTILPSNQRPRSPRKRR
jgi:hypothetical protein